MLNDFLAGQAIEDGNEENSKADIKKEIVIPQEFKSEYKTLKDYIEKNYNVEVTPDAHLELDLGLDLSLIHIYKYHGKWSS